MISISSPAFHTLILDRYQPNCQSLELIRWSEEATAQLRSPCLYITSKKVFDFIVVSSPSCIATRHVRNICFWVLHTHGVYYEQFTCLPPQAASNTKMEASTEARHCSLLRDTIQVRANSNRLRQGSRHTRSSGGRYLFPFLNCQPLTFETERETWRTKHDLRQACIPWIVVFWRQAKLTITSVFAKCRLYL